MLNWFAQLKIAGVILLNDGFIVNLSPEGEDTEKCKQFGVNISKYFPFQKNHTYFLIIN